MFLDIPVLKPNTPLLDGINTPSELRQLNRNQLSQVAAELRALLMFSVGKTGGHFGAALGVVELTVALHYVFNTPEDRLVWDVGHQTYPHKILTERKNRMHTLRQYGGLKGFPCRTESIYDTFGVGHSSTSISAAMGMSLAAAMAGVQRKVVAIIGDGAMTAGMAFEALNHAGHSRTNMLVILNDNNMSISENVGGLSNYFSRIWASRTYNSLRSSGKKVLEHMPSAMNFARRTEEYMKGMVAPGILFEELGFNYIGPIHGHDLNQLVVYLSRIRDLEGPQLLHVITQKGKGFAPAEADPIAYHALNKLEPTPSVRSTAKKIKPQTYSQVFGSWLCDMAALDKRLVGITPAMREGSGMVRFSKEFPERYHDVAIAEQHSVTLAAGLACDNQKPVLAIYSTFFQRAYDQLIHDVALQHLDVLFAVDRAGLVGEDGPTHAGSFDLSFLRCIPNMVVMAPSDQEECRKMLTTGFFYDGPAVVRYPRGAGSKQIVSNAMEQIHIGKGRIRREGVGIAFLAFGVVLEEAMQAADHLDATVVDMRFVKPLDESLIVQIAETHFLLITVEDNVVAGGAGSAVNEYIVAQGCRLQVSLLNLGLPDQFVSHGRRSDLLTNCGLDAKGIIKAVEKRIVQQENFLEDGLPCKVI